MKSIEFIKPVFQLEQIPLPRLPEIILCGRSNVGKSSFLNTFSGRKLAKVSATPGKTRSVNYFLVDGRYYLVDLPGFGYAKITKTERERWEKLLQSYFENSGYIAAAVHLIDSRHEPTPLDSAMKKMLEFYGIPSIPALTKIDKIPRSKRIQLFSAAAGLYPGIAMKQNAFYFSAVTGEGKVEAGRVILGAVTAFEKK